MPPSASSLGSAAKALATLYMLTNKTVGNYSNDVQAIEAHKEYVYELLAGFSNEFQKEEQLKREGAPSIGTVYPQKHLTKP